MVLRAALVAAVAIAGGACGTGGGDRGDARVVHIAMVDVAFEPDTIDVAAGETVRFVFTNQGDVAHDAFVGDREAQIDHAEDMNDEGDHRHGDDGITVEPGDTGELVHTFDEDGVLEIGCHQPGHYDAGMVVTVRVRARGR